MNTVSTPKNLIVRSDREAFVHGRAVRPDGSYDSLFTDAVDHAEVPMPHHLHNRQWTATGYGKRIPTPHMIRWYGKWRRVYCCIYSNIGTCYIGKLSDNLIVDIN
jgi:hypothetical protein